MAETVNTREIILNILMDISESGQPMHYVMSAWLMKYQYLEQQERHFITRVVRTTLEHEIWIDAMLNQYSSVKVKKMKPVIRNIMRMSACQMLFMDSVPEHAVCNEAVKLAVRRGFRGLKGFVNGVLRTIARNKEHLMEVLPDEQRNPEAYLSMRYSTPEWLVQLWCTQFGYDTAKKMLEGTETKMDTSIRVNTLKITPEALKAKLEGQKIHVEAGSYLPYVFKISGYDYLDAIESFQNGEFYVQDESSVLAGAVAGFKAGQTILDVCAAPGGKSINAAILTEDKANIEARDLTEQKVEKIQENVMRMHVHSIQPVQWDALCADEAAFETADIVIADLPCSGLGVIGRKTDIKYHMMPETIKELEALQKQILDVCWHYVKPGGMLLYSTCTVNMGENIRQVEQFLDSHPFTMQSLDDMLPEKLQSDLTAKGFLQLLPGVHDCDGFFVANLRRNEE